MSLNSQLNVYSEQNNKDRFKKKYNKNKSKVYVAEEQKNDKNINNERIENSFKMKKYKLYESDYHVMN